MPTYAFTRREFLLTGTAGVLVAAGALPVFADDNPYAPFRVGMQSYTLRGFSFEEALAMTQKLGIHYWEAFQAHIGQTADKEKQKAILDKLKAANIHLFGWGVEGFDGNEQKSRAVFEFAKAMGVDAISADPAPDSFDILDKLVAEYKINIAIHNHGPGTRYDKLPTVLNAVKNRHPRIGACVDTGHVLRSGEDPVEWIKALGPRVHDVHLKDVKDTKDFTVIGKGDLRTADLFRELSRIKFKGVVNLEYEEHEKDPMSYVEECFAATRSAIERAKKQS